MSDSENKPDRLEKDQPDRDLAEAEKPFPSQAEGDLETVEEDLKEKGNRGTPNPQ